MINITKLWTGVAQPADALRYDMGGHPHAKASTRKPITVRNITRTCNLRCVHCYSDSNALSYPGELDWSQMEAVVQDLAQYQIPSLLLSGGEPLVHPRFFDLVSLASAQGLKLTISANGAYVGISLDGSGEVHDQFRRKEGAFDGAGRGVRNCLEVGQKTGLRLTLTRHTVQNIGAILAILEQEQ